MRLDFPRDSVHFPFLDIHLVLWADVFVRVFKVDGVPLKLEHTLLTLPEVYKNDCPNDHDGREDHCERIVDEVAKLEEFSERC